MSHTVETLAAFVNGTVRGDHLRVIDDAAAIETASPSAVTFVLDQSHVGRLKECRAGAVFIDTKIATMINESVNCSLIVVSDTQLAFQKVLPLFRKVRGRPERGVSPQALISSTAEVGPNCYIAPGVCIGDEAVIGPNCDLHPGVVIGAGSQIGENTILHANAVVYHDVVIGKNVIIHAGAVIGADGFGYRFVGGRFEKIPQLGTVHIHDDVEIGACSTVDRGAVGPTIVGTGTKIDNLVMIAHNCEIGRHNAFASQVGIAGSSSTGDYVRLGGQVGVRDHIHLNTGCSVGAKSGVHKDIPAGETWLGMPASRESDQKRLLIAMKRVPDMRDDLKALQKQVALLVAEIEQLKNILSNSENTLPRRAAG